MKRHLALLILGCIVASSAPAADPVELAEFRALPRPEPALQIRYGAAEPQGTDLFLPTGPGPHPVAILIHGGCWSAKTAGREQLRHLGAELAKDGIAVWNIGYRRANEPGGGHPGTYQDVATALDRLRAQAPAHRLDLSRTVLVGHSAGGHLALWAAARAGIPPDSPLHVADPFVPGAAISLAGVGDIERFARFVPVVCGEGILDHLAPPGHFAEVSPAAMPPPQVPVVLVSAVIDRLVPPYAAYDYARALRGKAMAAVRLVDIPEAGHFDLVTPGTPAWKEVRRLIDAALAGR